MANMDRIKQLMKDKGLKVQYVCDRLGSSRYKLYDWERGKSTPSENELKVLSDILDVSVAYLKGESENRNEQKNKPTTNRDKLIAENIDLFEQLTTDNKQKILDYLRYTVENQDKK